MVFHGARMKNIDFDTSMVCMNGMKLERTDCFKYLGVILDSNITWTQHISNIKNTVSKGNGIMYKARQYLDKKALLNIYYSYIYPYFIYWIEVWGKCIILSITSLISPPKENYSNNDHFSLFGSYRITFYQS